MVIVFRLMDSKPLIISAVVLLVLCALVFTIQPRPRANASSSKEPPQSTSVDKAKLKQLMADLPLAFELNTGQADSRVKFLANSNGAQLLLESGKATLLTTSGHFRFTFGGANLAANVHGADQLIERRNYLIGNDSAKWRTDVPTFRKVIYDDIYPGIDLTYYGNAHEIEYDFEVDPGADPRTIRLVFDPKVRPRISTNGDLLLRFGSTRLVHRKPQVYQEIDGGRRTIESQYVLLRNREVGFEIGDYDQSKPLIIDPTLVYSTYLGGTSDDPGSSIALDNIGHVYVTGTTSSVNFPTQGPAYPNNKGLSYIFITSAAAVSIVLMP
jgi:hypothetical protein